MDSRSSVALLVLVFCIVAGAGGAEGPPPTSLESPRQRTDPTWGGDRIDTPVRPNSPAVSRERQRLLEAGISVPALPVLLQWTQRLTRCLNDRGCRWFAVNVGTGMHLIAVKQARGAVRVYEGNTELLRRISAEAERDPVQWGNFLMRLFSGGGIVFDFDFH